MRDGEITLHTRERSNKWQMYINIKGTDVFVRKSTGTSNLDDAAQIATNYYDKLKANASTASNSATGVIGWIDERLPILSFVRDHLTNYYAPKNFNFWYFFGSLAFLILFLQIFIAEKKSISVSLSLILFTASFTYLLFMPFEIK